MTYNIWIGAGTHHWFFCPEDYDSTLTNVCSNSNLQWKYPLTNNVELNVMALDCYDNYFATPGYYGNAQLFYDNCVDVNREQRPLIRVSSKYSYFNITSTATFQNLEFDGLDLNAELYYPDSCSADLSYLPLKKCSFDEDTSSFVTNLNLVEGAALDEDCAYNCTINNYDPDSLLDYINQDCEAASSGEMGGTAACSGLPYHEDFFTVDSQGQYT